MRQKIVPPLVALVAILVVAGVAAASKPNSSLNLVVVGSAGSAATVQPTYGSQVTFDVSTNQTDHPYVNVRCNQTGVFVYDSWAAFWAGAPQGDTLTLSSGYWTGGAADCTARLVAFDKQGHEQTLASMDFHVAA